MHQLIHIRQELIGNQRVNSVNARELHTALHIKRDFSNWIKSQIESLGLEENIDYITTRQKRRVGAVDKEITEYIITQNTAKHISMASRTPKGKEVRNYFIKVEKEFKKRMFNHYQISGYKSQIAQKNKKIQKLLEYKDSLEQCRYFYLLQEKELKDLKKENEKLRKMLIDRLLITDKDKTEPLRCITISEFSEMLDDIGYEFESRSASILENAKKLLSDLARDTVVNMHRRIAKIA